ncbi:MAG: F0F1 ATP synthase subunit A [Candidatus Celaenobacter antarcticus]|nr:F0F1 ATP synthase subunit A [Candidatus Celaenobacter antarcticus]
MKKKSKKALIIILTIIIIEGILSVGVNRELQIGFDDGRFVIRNIENEQSIQDQINHEFQNYHMIDLFGKFTINWSVIRVILFVDLFLILFAVLVRRKMHIIPGKLQIIAETTYSFFSSLVIETIGEEKRYFTPYIFTIFVFIWLCNIIGMIPIPGNLEPTRNLNVPLGLGLMAIIVVHYSAIKEKGIVQYLKEFTAPISFMLPINIVGEFAKVISISFRLFGNILGGAIIVLVVSNLTRFILIPVGLNLFFGLFIGTVQAFVFTMLVLSYTAVAIK